MQHYDFYIADTEHVRKSNFSCAPNNCSPSVTADVQSNTILQQEVALQLFLK